MTGKKKTDSGSAGVGFYLLPTTVGTSNHDLTRTSSPAYSFGSKSSTGVRESPGPDTYDISHLTRNGRPGVPSYILGSRLQHGGWYPSRKNESPGPGSYSPELYGSIQSKCTTSRKHLRRSRFCAADRPRVKFEKSCNSPGPASYDVTPLDNYKTRSPGVKMAPPVAHTYNSR